MLRSKLLSFACCALFASSSVFAQETEVETTSVETTPVETVEVKKADTSVTLSEDGELIGKVFAKVEGKEKALEAKVTIANEEGVIVSTVDSKEDGSFAFPSLEPGVYQMFGSSGDYYGGQSVDVMPFSGGGTCQSCNLGLDTGVSYDSYASAPAASCGGCGGGGGGFGGGGGGLLSGRRLLRLGLIGGVVAIATSDSSPDN